MNTISQIMQSIVSQMQASEPKALELKAGQIVNGLVLQLFMDNEALVNIGGVQVRARLELPLRQGDSALLQVQPESANGQVVLKPIQASSGQITGEPLAEMLKNVGLPNTSANRQLVQQMQQEGVLFTKETMRALSETLAGAPKQVQADTWQQAAFVAVKRGLPVTEQTVGSLHQAMFGKPASAQASDLARELGALLAREGAAKPGAAPLSAAAAGVLQQAKQQLDALLGLLAQRPGGAAAPGQAAPLPAAGAPAGGAGQAAVPGQAQPAQAAQPPALAPQAQPQPAAAPLAAGAASAGAGSGGAAVPARAAGEAAAPPAQGGSAAAGGAGASGTAAPAAAAAASQAPVPAAKPAQQAAQPAGAAPAGAEAPAPEAAGEPWLGKLLKAFGVEHESRFAKQLASGGLEPPSQSELSAALSGRANGDEGAKPLAETLKGALLQLSSLDEAPPSVKEAAQQLVQQITGQQLLLTTDRSSMFAHVTMMVPLRSENGEHNATVHIQSRKGRNGEIDANNCRLIFDLHMKSIGNTMLDVQVFDKIVSLNVHNDQPFIAELLESNRDDIAAGLERIGYQFLSLRCSPYPERLSAEAQETKRTAEDGRSVLGSLYNAKPYKGVDIRV